MGRHAYLIAAHDDFYVLRQLIRLINDPRNDIYLHVDRRSVSFNSRVFLAEFEGFRLSLAPRMKVYWGDYTHVRSILALMKMALSGGQYDYLHLLSGADLPLKSQDYIHGFCRENRGMEFVAYNRMGADQVEWVKYAYPFNRYLRSPSGLLRSAYKRLRHRTLNAQRSMGIDRRTRFEGQIKYGSDWFSITSDLAKRLLAREATVKYVFKQAFIPSEFFVQTILWDSDLRDRIFDLGNPYRSNMRYIDFSRRSGSSPYVFREGDFEALVASDRLFARKFDSRIDRLIVDKMFDHLVAQY